MSKIVLKTPRLVLKPMSLKYLESTHVYSSDLENTKLMVNLPNFSKEETIEFLTEVEKEWNSCQQTDYEFAILLQDIHIGSISLYLENDGFGELGWIIDKRYWNHGYVTEAAETLVKYAVETLGIKHFRAYCDSENIGSYRVMEKLGMELMKRSFGRKNKASDEIREELIYELKMTPVKSDLLS